MELPRKFEAVQRNTTARSRRSPKVCRAMPPTFIDTDGGFAVRSSDSSISRFPLGVLCSGPAMAGEFLCLGSLVASSNKSLGSNL